MKRVFPLLEKICHILGMQFNVVDMRWGVRESTNDSHGTSAFCMKHLQRCLEKSQGPAFVCLLGNKYGYRPFPSAILETELNEMWEVYLRDRELKRLLEHAASNPIKSIVSTTNDIHSLLKSKPLSEVWTSLTSEQRQWLTDNNLCLIPQWFHLDRNAIPDAQYVLLNITSHLPDFRSKVKSQQEAASKKWWSMFETIQGDLRMAVGELIQRNPQKTPKELEEKYIISVTEEEVCNGIITNENRLHQSSIFLREIKDIDHNPEISQRKHRKFTDIKPDGSIDMDARNRLKVLKEKISSSYPGLNVISYEVKNSKSIKMCIILKKKKKKRKSSPFAHC
jgi:hypothetical protein